MGWTAVSIEERTRSIHRDHAGHLVGPPRVYVKNGTYHVEIHMKKSAPLRALMEIVSRLQEHGMNTATPLRVKIWIDHNGKVHVLTFAIATKGVKYGRPEFPFFTPAGTAFHVAPDYPRKGSSNYREIAGQYIAAFMARRSLRPKDVVTLASSDVGVEIQRRRGNKKEPVRQTDIDLFHLRRIRTKSGEYYELTPVEVTTSLDPNLLKKKIDAWKELANILERLAKNEKKELVVKPFIVHVSAGHAKNGKGTLWYVEKQFPGTSFIQIESAGRIGRGTVTVNGEFGHAEYIGATLKNIAKLPRRFHTDLVSILLQDFKSKEHLKMVFRDISILRKIWRMRSIPTGVKHFITDRYVEHAIERAENPLILAIDEAKERFVEHAERLERKKMEIVEKERHTE